MGAADLHLSPKVTHIIGLDEVGWGAGTGPIIVAGAVLPRCVEDPGFKDSKRFTTDRARRKGAEFAMANVLAWDIEEVPHDVVAAGPATALAKAQLAVVTRLLKLYPDAMVVVDGNRLVPNLSKKKQRAVVGADASVCAVSAASIIAKVIRDEFMSYLGKSFPEWNWHKNKGYLTADHLAKLEAWGPTPWHRTNIEVVRKALEAKGPYEVTE